MTLPHQNTDIPEHVSRVAKTPTTPVVFDLQGRSLVETDDAIYSLDHTDNAEFQNHIKTTLGLDDAVFSAYKRSPKESIIPLQHEYDFHLRLVEKVYESIHPELADTMAVIHKNVMEALQKHINQDYANALKQAYSPDNKIIDMAKLNKSLDASRKKLMPLAHELLVKKLVRQTGFIPEPKELEKKSLKKRAEITPATDKPFIHTSPQGITCIEGSKHTAHLREQGTEFAHKRIRTWQKTKDGSFQEHPRVQIRTPSPVVKEGLSEDGDYIKDVASKFQHLATSYGMNDAIPKPYQANLPQIFIYNSFTAFNDRLDDLAGKNKQTQSARHILLGVHQFNQAQLSQNPPVWGLVMNCSVNGFGDTLGYGSGNALREETTLMAELATLYNLSTSIHTSDQDRATIASLFDHYKTFLQQENKPEYFSQSPQGKSCIKAIYALKNDWKEDSKEEMKTRTDRAAGAVRMMFAHDLHHKHEHSKWFQALSLYIEPVSVSGCKSGNERTQSIYGRLSLLDKPGNERIDKLLIHLAQSNEPEKHARNITSEFDKLYNASALHNSTAFISSIDQGASYKVEAKPASGWYISRNLAESSSLDYLHQSKASGMQAHKNMAKAMEQAWLGQPQTFWQRMNASPLKQVGAVLGIVFFPIAIGVAIRNNLENNERLTALKNELQMLKKEYEKTQLEKNIPEGASYKIMTQNMPTITTPNATNTSTLTHKEETQEQVKPTKSNHEVIEEPRPSVGFGP